MSARQQLRIGNRRLGRDRAPIDATPAPPVGETLQLARERKGVDLFRAERDTKIRLRYLSALEDGAYEDLPSPVYTKGFLRNYAIYLGLDPEDLLERWRDEMESIRSAERVAVAPPPMPIAAPGRRVTITPAMFVAGLVLLVILAFVGYLGIQLLRYAEVTPVALTKPPDRVSTIEADLTILEGTSGPGATITIRGPTTDLFNTTANEKGEWSREVPLARGPNRFTITATDPVTQRESTELVVTINRPLPSISPGVSPSAAPPITLTMSVSSPLDGAVSTDGNVVVSGITTGSRVTIESLYIPVVSASPSPVTTPSPTPTAVTPSSPSPAPSGSPPPIVDLTIPDSGAFSKTLALTIGRWELTITTYGIGVPPVTETRTITVAPPVVSGVQLIINVSGRDSWVRATADGARIPGLGRLSDGDARTLTAVSEVCLRTGNAGALELNLNGLDIGFLGRFGEVGSWLFRPGVPPEPTDDAC
ncbi:MAG: RodZ domain-containing protein [Candidatus Limnocylindrales bacterium]